MENLDKWERAGAIAAKALAYGKGLIKKNSSLLEASNLIEEKIRALGGGLAFPVQISCDNIAAHYCADPDDSIIFQNQVASLDVGVHVDGCIGDCAGTVDLSGSHSDLVKASEEALNAAIKIANAGVELREIGKTINEVIASYNLMPVRNLSGHGLSPYNIHDAPTIPNYDDMSNETLEKDMIIAIEPFATTGVGMIQETERANIFSFVAKTPVRSAVAREVLAEIQNYDELPFTTRWLVKKFPLFKLNFALRELARAGCIHSFPPLTEKAGGIVSQAEHTLYIGDRTKVLTKECDD